MNNTRIEWTDYTWNPITGCRRGCAYCYARAMYRRFGRSFEPTFHPDRLEQPVRHRRPARIFVCSVADILGAGVSREWREAVIDVMRRTPRHTYQLLTTTPGRYAEHDWPRNAWLGATATDQRQWDAARAALAPLEGAGRVAYISAEPLLGPIAPGGWMPSWLIIGAQTGPGGRQPEEAWVEKLERDAAPHDVPIFHKPNLAIRPAPRHEFPIARPVAA